jgi:4a-hydroxytetrahydrobiopterin dehydratase
MVALVRDRNYAAVQPEREQQLGGRGHEARDSHSPTMALLSDQQIEQRLAERAHWERRGDAIVRTVVLDDFAASIELVNRIAPLAEEMNHHPDLEISWNRVTISLSTHSQGGLTGSDFALAEQIDALA